MRLLVVALLSASCVTAGDLQRVSDSVARLEQAADAGVSQEEFREHARISREEIEDVVESVGERTRGAITGLSQASEGGLIGLVGAIASAAYVNHRRNSQRRLRGEPTGSSAGTGT